MRSRSASWRHAFQGTVFSLGFLTCIAGTVEARPPDVYVLMVDTLRADHLSAYGYSRPTSPNLDRFAQSALLFRDTVAPCSWTLPSIGTLFTGNDPTAHGLLAHRTGPMTVQSLRPGVPTLAEAFQDAGYHTVAVVTNVWLSEQTGLRRGFEHFDVKGTHDPEWVNERARALLEQAPAEKPVFLYLHYMNTHQKWEAPELPPEVLGPVEQAERVIPEKHLPHARNMVAPRESWGPDEGRTVGYFIDAYDREIHRWDRAFGEWIRWLRETGRDDRSWITVVSDHGEELYERGGWGHGQHLFQEIAAVPWILRGPGGKPRGRVEQRVSLLDFPRTLLAAAGVPVPAKMRGADVRESVPDDRRLFAESNSWRGGWRESTEQNWEQAAVWDGRRKLLLHGRRFRLYDLEKDPDERNALPSDATLEAALNEWYELNRKRAEEFGKPARQVIDESVHERLRALGYE